MGRRGGVGAGERDAEDRVGAEIGLVGRAVEVDQRGVDRAWSAASSPESAGAIVSFTFSTALRTPLPPIAGLVAVAQLDRLVGAGRGAGRDCRPADRAVGEDDLHLDGGVAARIEDLAGVDVGR